MGVILCVIVVLRCCLTCQEVWQATVPMTVLTVRPLPCCVRVCHVSYLYLAVMTAIRELLVEPGTESPLRGDVAELYTRDRSKYDETVREYVNKYAS